MNLRVQQDLERVRAFVGALRSVLRGAYEERGRPYLYQVTASTPALVAPATLAAGSNTVTLELPVVVASIAVRTSDVEAWADSVIVGTEYMALQALAGTAGAGRPATTTPVWPEWRQGFLRRFVVDRGTPLRLNALSVSATQQWVSIDLETYASVPSSGASE